jgi:hypothetical protein
MPKPRNSEEVERPVRRLQVTVNKPDKEECRRVAREERDYWNDRYDHDA